MAIRIGEYVLAGELRNTKRNSIVGWIEFAPNWGVRLELNGNLSGDFVGMHLRFRVRRPTSADFEPGADVGPSEMPEFIHRLADRQIGVIGDLRFHQRKIPNVSATEWMNRQDVGSADFAIKDVLSIEWHGPNGRVIAEIVDPEIELATEELSPTPTAEPLDDSETDTSGPSITRVQSDGEGNPVAEEAADPPAVNEDHYGLFDDGLEKHIRESLSDSTDRLPWQDGVPDERKKRSWDEVIPGIDPETKALYEQWDEIYGGEKDEALTTLFDPPLKIPAVDSVTTDEQAQPILAAIIGRMAMLNVAFDLCKHASPLTAYRCLVEEILPIAHIHPKLADTDIVQHYSMFEFCAECAAEFEAEYEAGEMQNQNSEKESDG